ncbi:tyrosine-type recombinase/integrase [Mangrovicoccus algicola]|nr:tyrosine-type recombinase/integrase [Mangrovicoccus algicola]
MFVLVIGVSVWFRLKRRNSTSILHLDGHPGSHRQRRRNYTSTSDTIASIGPLSADGPRRPWRSSDSFRNCFKRWCIEAGLPDRSPHGIRKAAGHLLAEAGATQHQIMAVHGHSQARTSEVYTRDVQRSKLAESAVTLLAGMEW